MEYLPLGTKVWAFNRVRERLDFGTIVGFEQKLEDRYNVGSITKPFCYSVCFETGEKKDDGTPETDYWEEYVAVGRSKDELLDNLKVIHQTELECVQRLLNEKD